MRAHIRCIPSTHHDSGRPSHNCKSRCGPSVRGWMVPTLEVSVASADVHRADPLTDSAPANLELGGTSDMRVRPSVV